MDILSNYILVDIETTGFSFYKDEIVELCAVKVINNKIHSNFSTLIKPINKIPYNVIKIHGINNEMVKNCETIDFVLPNFINFIEDNILVAHNANFDLSFLQRDIFINLNKIFTPLYVDTVSLAHRVLNLEHYNLKSIASYYNVDTKGHHRGLKDCLILYECFENMNKFGKTKFYKFDFKINREKIDSSLLKVQTKLF